MRQYFDVDLFEFKNNNILKFKNFRDFNIDIKNNNFKFKDNNDFTFFNKNDFVINNANKSEYIMYIIYKIYDRKIFFGITNVAIEFNPLKDVILYYKSIKSDSKFGNTLISFYFDSYDKEFYEKYDPLYFCLFEQNFVNKKPFVFNKDFVTEEYQPEFFQKIEIPKDFEMTKTNTVVNRLTPIGLRNHVFNHNIEKILDNTYYGKRRRDDYLEEFNETVVSNIYDINNPESMFFDFTENSTSQLSFMYINGEKVEFKEEFESAYVPKGEFGLYYNKREKKIGIRYVNPRWFPGMKKANPLLRSYIYIKRLSFNMYNERMDDIIVDFYNNDYFHLYRLEYKKNDSFNKYDKSVSFDDFEKKFKYYKDNYRFRRPILRRFTDRYNPYIDKRIRYEY